MCERSMCQFVGEEVGHEVEGLGGFGELEVVPEGVGEGVGDAVAAAVGVAVTRPIVAVVLSRPVRPAVALAAVKVTLKTPVVL